MVARLNLACFALFFLSTVLITHSMSEARLCRDPLCNKPISIGKVKTNFEGNGGKEFLELKVGEKVYIYAKEPDKTPELWYGELQSTGKGGYFPKEHVEELVVYESNPQFVISKDILNNSDDPGGTADKDSNSSETKPTESNKEEENKESSEKSGEDGKTKEEEGTVSGIINTISDFFSVPAGEDVDHSTLSNEQSIETVVQRENSLDKEKSKEVEKQIVGNLESGIRNGRENNIENRGSVSEINDDKSDKQTQVVDHNKGNVKEHSFGAGQQKEGQGNKENKVNDKLRESTLNEGLQNQPQKAEHAKQEELRSSDQIGNSTQKVQAPGQNMDAQNFARQNVDGQEFEESTNGAPHGVGEKKLDDGNNRQRDQVQMNTEQNPENQEEKVETGNGEDKQKTNDEQVPGSPEQQGNKMKYPESKKEGESIPEKKSENQQMAGNKENNTENKQAEHPIQNDGILNSQEKRKEQKGYSDSPVQPNQGVAETEERVEDALKLSVDETEGLKEAIVGEEYQSGKEDSNMKQSSSEALNSKGEKKLPQFIPGEYMSLPREELLKVLEERQKILNAQPKEDGESAGYDIGDEEKREIFKPAVHSPDSDDSEKGQRSMDEVVENVQENLKAVVEEDLSHLGKASEVKPKKELLSEDRLGIRGVNGEIIENKDMQNNGKTEQGNRILSDVSSDTKAEEDSSSPEREYHSFSSKGKAILFHRRKLKERAEQEHFEGSIRSEVGASKQEELADEERNVKKVENNSAINVDSTAADAGNNPSQVQGDNTVEEEESEDEEEEDYEEVEPLNVRHQNEKSKQNGERAAFKDKVKNSATVEEKVAKKEAALQKHEGKLEENEEPQQKLDEGKKEALKSKQEDEQNNVQNNGEKEEELRRQNEVGRQKEELTRRKEEELKKQKEEELKKQKEEELKKQKEELRKQKEEELRMQKEEELRKQKEEELRRQKEEVLRRQKEELRKQKEEELKRQKEEEKQKEEELRRQKEEEIRQKEEEIQKQKEDEIRRQKEEEIEKQKEDERRRQKEEEIQRQKEEEIRKQKEEELRRQKEEEEHQARLQLLQEERKRVQALDEQAKLLLERKKEYERKAEEDRQRRENEKRQKEKQRKERIKLEVEKRLKAKQEEMLKKEEEERKKELEEQKYAQEKQKMEEEKRKIEDEKKRKEEENKKMEEEVLKIEEEHRKKNQDESKIFNQEHADKIKEEMEIEAELKTRLEAMARNESVKPKEGVEKTTPDPLNDNQPDSTDIESKNIKSENWSSRRNKAGKESFLKNKFKNLKMKVGTTKSKTAGRKAKNLKKKKKKKRKFYDISEIHLDQISCLSIPNKKRMSCGVDLTEEECHDDGCCFDEDAPPEIQCFYPPREQVHGDGDEDEEDYEGDEEVDYDRDEFKEKKKKKRRNKGRSRLMKAKDKKPPPAAGKLEEALAVGGKTEESITTIGNQETATSVVDPPPSAQATQGAKATIQTTQVNQDTSGVNTASSVINTTPTQVMAQSTASTVADAGHVPKQPVDNGTSIGQEGLVTDTRPPVTEGAPTTAPSKQDIVNNEKLQPKVTYSEDKSMDRRFPPQVPPTLPTVIQTPINGKEIPSVDGKADSVPQEKPETPSEELPALTPQTTSPIAEDGNTTKKAKRKSFGILKGFWRFHEIFAEKVITFVQPLKGTLSGILSCIGLGQVFEDICRDLASAPPVVIASTMVFGGFGVVFLFWSCITSFSSGDAAKGPSPRDILKTYESRIRILEEEIEGVEKSCKELQLKSDHSIEEKYHSDEAANTARKSLEQTMLRVKQSESEIQRLQEIIRANKQEIKAINEEIEQKDEEMESMQQVASGHMAEIQIKEKLIARLKEQLEEFVETRETLGEEIEALKETLDNQEHEKTRLIEEVEERKEKYNKLQQDLDDEELKNSRMQEQYTFKCSEVEVLQDCLLQIKGQEYEEDQADEPLSEEERDKIRSERLQAMLDASKSKTEAKIMQEENRAYKTELEETKNAKESLEEKIQNLEQNLSEAKLNEERAYLDAREREIELAALRKYFKDSESELHRKLTAEESAREATENKLKTELSKATSDSQDLNTYKKLYADINEEIQRLKSNVGHQVAAVEERAHNNWLKYRTVERELEEVKRERDALRRRMYTLEKEKNRPGSSASAKSSDSTDGVRVESPIRGPLPPGHPAASRVPERHSPVPVVPQLHHPMHGPPPSVMSMGYGPPPPPGKFGPAAPSPQGYMGTPPPPGRNGPAVPPPGRKDSGTHTPRDERYERERRDSRGYGTISVRDNRRSGLRSVTPPNGGKNNVESPASFSTPPISSSTPGDSRQTKLRKIQNSLENDRDSLREDYDSRPRNESPPAHVPHLPGPPMNNSPMTRPPYGPRIGPPMGPPPMGPPPMGPPPMGPPPMGSPMRQPYGPPRGPPMSSPMGLQGPPPPGQNPVPGPPMGAASGPNAYRRVSGNRPPTHSLPS